MFFVPEYAHNLVSVSRVIANGSGVNFGLKSFIKASGTTIIPLRNEGNLYILDVWHRIAQSNATATLKLWHKRMAHNNTGDLKRLPKLVEGMTISDHTVEQCDSCDIAKAKHQPVKRRTEGRATGPLDVVHSDVLGPMHVISSEGFKYAIGFCDSFSRYTNIYMLRTREEVITKLK